MQEVEEDRRGREGGGGGGVAKSGEHTCVEVRQTSNGQPLIFSPAFDSAGKKFPSRYENVAAALSAAESARARVFVP